MEVWGNMVSQQCLIANFERDKSIPHVTFMPAYRHPCSEPQLCFVTSVHFKPNCLASLLLQEISLTLAQNIQQEEISQLRIPSSLIHNCWATFQTRQIQPRGRHLRGAVLHHRHHGPRIQHISKQLQDLRVQEL